MSGTTAAVVYALSLGHANDQPIDYNTTWGQKQYADATKKLSDNQLWRRSKEPKDVLERLNSRAEESGWTEITKNQQQQKEMPEILLQQSKENRHWNKTLVQNN